MTESLSDPPYVPLAIARTAPRCTSTGTKTVTFDIVGKLLNSGTITGYDANGIETDGNCTYDGTEHKFAKVVADIKDGNMKLVEGTDYDLVYVDNVYGKKGTKTVGSKPVDVQRGAVLAIAKGTYGGSLNDSVNGVEKVFKLTLPEIKLLM